MQTKVQWFQKLYYKESVTAIKSSTDYISFDSFYDDLMYILPQHAISSKIRIRNNIIKRFFPHKSLVTMPTQVWHTYKDDKILREIIIYKLLEQEPVLKDFILAIIDNHKIESKIPQNIFKDYIVKTYAKEIKNLVWWLQSALKEMGYIYKINNSYYLADNSFSKLGFLLLLTENIESCQFNDLINSDFAKYSQLPAETIKNYLLEYDIRGLINFKNDIISINSGFDEILAKQISF